MSEPYFELTIEDGKITAEGQGFEGQGCEEIAKLLQQLGKTEVHKRKPEFYRRAGYASRQATTE